MNPIELVGGYKKGDLLIIINKYEEIELLGKSNRLRNDDYFKTEIVDIIGVAFFGRDQHHWEKREHHTISYTWRFVNPKESKLSSPIRGKTLDLFNIKEELREIKLNEILENGIERGIQKDR